MQSSIPHIREVLVFLTAAGVLVPLFQKFKVSPVLGFLIAGLLLGPHGAGLLATIWPPASAIVITESAGVHALAELGIVFLLFTIGLELSFERLTTMRRKVFGFGSAQVVLSAVVIGLIARAFHNSPEASILLGLGFALSSTAIVMQILAENKRMGSMIGRYSFAVLLFQDLSIILLLFILGFVNIDLKGGISTTAMIPLAKAVGFAVAAVVAIIVLGRMVLRPLFGMVGKNHNRELFMAATLLTVIGIAAGAESAGLSMGLGAFLAGLLLAETDYRHDIEITIEPFKGLLLGLFFMSVGMGVDLHAVVDEPFWIPVSVIGLFLIKGGIIYLIARGFKISHGRAIELGLLLGQGGEFVFVVLAMADTMHLMPESVSQFMLIVTSLTMMVTPLVARVGYRIRLALDGPDQSIYGPAAAQVDEIENHVILAGYGRMGHLLGQVLDREKIPAIAIDTNPDQQKSSTVPVLLGDAASPAALVKAGIHRAVALAVLMDRTEDAIRVVEAVRTLKPRLPVIARARDAAHALVLHRAGATTCIPDVIEGSLHVAHELLTRIGVPEATAAQAINLQRAHETHDIEAALRDDK